MVRVRAFLALVALAVVALVTRPAEAHPLLQDHLEIVRDPRAESEVTILITSTLRATLTALGRAPRAGAFYAPDEVERAVQEGLPYLLAHLHVEIDHVPVTPTAADVSLTGPVTQPVHRLLDTEKLFSRATLRFRAPGRRPSTISLSHTMLTDVVEPSGARFSLDYVVADAPGGARVLRAGETLDLPLGAARASSSGETFVSFLREGALHILGGFDHLLFLAAIALGALRVRSLFVVVAAFTLAHTVTLTLATLGLVHVPAAIVEPLIGVSIVVAAALALTGRARGRALTAFGFGLVHGLGFASGLDAALGGDRAHLALALLAFTVGIEVVQQALVLPAFALARAARKTPRGTRVVEWATLIVIVLGALFVVQALKRGG